MEEGGSDLRQRKPRKDEKTMGPGKHSTSDRKSINSLLPDYFGYGLIITFLILIKFFSAFENFLPDQLKIKDANSNPGRFIGERAELQLKRLTDLGTKVVGSYENEVLAVDFLKREISFIAQESNKIHNIEIDVQKPTGSYYLFLRPFGFRNYYANIQNIVVKLSSHQSTNSVLLNCHYDTVPESPGASDNGLNCAVMLEILRVLSTSSTPLKNNVIFLFNGAEENPLQASHGFLSQHKWSKEIKVVINLDSAGAGGREILFQTSGEPWLVYAYAKSVPRPCAGVQAEELFQFGIIPSDTDFRIFRDFGNYSGFDIAHASNGYIYHTKFDKMDYIRPGVYQNTGDNILALLRELVNSPELGRDQPKTKIVYTDVFTFFMIVYTQEFGVVLNIVTALLSLCGVWKTLSKLPSARQSVVKSVLISTGGQLLGVMLAAAVIFLVSKTLDVYQSTMSWYLRPWLIIPLYAFPVVVSLAASFLLVQTFMEGVLLEHKVIRFLNGAQILWTVVLLLGTVAGIRSSFVIMLVVLFPSIGSLCVSLFKRTFTVKKYLMTYVVCLIFPTLFSLQQCVRIFMTMIPMTARMGPHKNPEIIIGGLAFVTIVTFVSEIVPLLLLLRKPKKFLIGLCVVHIVAMAIIMTTSFGFPYDGNPKSPAFQRFYLLHCERAFHDAKGSVTKSDSGIFVQSLDRNNLNYVWERVPELKNARSVGNNCDNEMFCGFPVFTSRFIQPAHRSFWVPVPPPTIHHPTSLEVVNQTQISVRVRRIRILVTGPDHITIGLSPRENVSLIRWSFEEGRPVEIENWNERKTYMVYYSHGLMGGTLEFDLDLEVPTDQTGNLMDVVVVGHYMHDKKLRTDEFKKLISRFPDWAHVTPWTTTYKSWII